MNALRLILLSLMTALSLQAETQSDKPPQGWFKGDLKVTTRGIPGNPSALETILQHKNEGFDFLSICDRNIRTTVPPESLTAHDAPLFFPSEGLTGLDGVRCNTLNPRTNLIDSTYFVLPYLTLLHHSRRAKEQQTLFTVSPGKLNASNLVALPNFSLLEVTETTEALWDSVLSSGRKVYAVPAGDPFFIMVRTRALKTDSLLCAIREGRTYITRGTQLDELKISATEYSLKLIKPAHIDFISLNGRIIKSVDGLEGSCPLSMGEGYLRAKVSDGKNVELYTQPVFLKYGKEYQNLEKETLLFAEPFLRAERAYAGNDFVNALNFYEEALQKVPAGQPELSVFRQALSTRRAITLRLLGRESEAKLAAEACKTNGAPGLFSRIVSHEIKARQYNPTVGRSGPPWLSQAFPLPAGDTIRLDGIDKEEFWMNTPWDGFHALESGIRDTTVFRLAYDSLALYAFIRASMPETTGLAYFVPARHENISFAFDPNRAYTKIFTIDNNTPGIKSFVLPDRSKKRYTIEYRIPWAVIGVAAPRPGDIWNFNMARTHQKFGALIPHHWTEQATKDSYSSGYGMAGEEALNPLNFSLLLFRTTGLF